MSIRRMTRLALLTAAALILYVIELQLPPLFPIPGAKLGLANIITVYAVYHFRPLEVLLLLLTRILLGSFFAGQMTVLFYSLAGGLLCLAAALALRRIVPPRALTLSSICGAIAHNTGQIGAAVLLMGTADVLYWYPYLVLVGAAAGLFTGLTAQLIARRLPARAR